MPALVLIHVRKRAVKIKDSLDAFTPISLVSKAIFAAAMIVAASCWWAAPSASLHRLTQ